MALKFNWSRLLFLLWCITSSSCSCTCDVDTTTGQTCDKLFIILENALLSNGSNLYKLREMLLKDPPELVNITYHLHFNSEYVNDTTDGDDNMPELPGCLCSEDDAMINQTVFNNTNGTVVLRYGWTSKGIYLSIHPALLNQLQIQLPFSILRMFVNNNHPFLWNGYNQLPSIHLHLSIPSLPCLPYTNQLDGVMKRLTSLLKHYVQTENDSHIPIKADYGIDGQFVSNWNDILHNGDEVKRSNLFLRQEVEFIGAKFYWSLFISQYIIIFFFLLLLIPLAFKVMKYYKSIQTKDYSSSAQSLYKGFIICFVLFGLAMFVTELIVSNFSYYDSNSIINHRFGIIIFVLIIPVISLSVLFLVFLLKILCYCFTKPKELLLYCIYYFHCLCSSSKIKLYVLLGIKSISIYFSIFSIAWILISLLPTLLLSLAYPMNVIILFTLHVSCFGVTIIVFALFVTIVNFCRNNYCKQEEGRVLRCLINIRCFTAIGYIILSLCIAVTYGVVLCVYGSTIVERIFPEDRLVEALLLLPSSVVIIGAWLLHRKVFTTIKVQSPIGPSDVVDEIEHLVFPTRKRAELGKHLGILSKEICYVELKAMAESDSKKAVLTEMIKLWFDRNKSASLAALVDILESKMGMKLDMYETKGRLDSCMTVADIELVLTELGTSLGRVAAGLVTDTYRSTTKDVKEKMRKFLTDWINCKKEDATCTWIAFIRGIETIDKEAAKKIETMRLTNDAKEEDTVEEASA